MSLRFGAVLLAAGEARRMRGIDKLRLSIDGRPLLRRALDALRAAGAGPIVVVTGHRPERIRALLEGCGATLVHNARWEDGQQSSVLAGLAAIDDTVDAVMIALGDMPLVELADLRALADAFGRRSPGRAIVVPFHRGDRGNPVVFDASLRAPILARGPDEGARGFVAGHPELVERYEAGNDHFCVDLDTPEDIERLEARLGTRLGRAD